MGHAAKSSTALCKLIEEEAQVQGFDQRVVQWVFGLDRLISDVGKVHQGMEQMPFHPLHQARQHRRNMLWRELGLTSNVKRVVQRVAGVGWLVVHVVAVPVGCEGLQVLVLFNLQKSVCRVSNQVAGGVLVIFLFRYYAIAHHPCTSCQQRSLGIIKGRPHQRSSFDQTINSGNV